MKLCSARHIFFTPPLSCHLQWASSLQEYICTLMKAGIVNKSKIGHGMTFPACLVSKQSLNYWYWLSMTQPNSKITSLCYISIESEGVSFSDLLLDMCVWGTHNLKSFWNSKTVVDWKILWCVTEAFSTTCTAKSLPSVGLRHSVLPVLLGVCQVWDWGIQYHHCSTYRGFWQLVVVQLLWLNGRTLAAQARGVLVFDSWWLSAFSLSVLPHNI